MKPKINLVVDVADNQYFWAHGNAARQISKHLSDKYDFQILKIGENELTEHSFCDVLLVFPWKSFLSGARWLQASRKLFGVYDWYSWPNDFDGFMEAAHAADSIWTANERMFRAFCGLGERFGKAGLYLCQDGTDASLFPLLPHRPGFAVGWTGNSAAGGGDWKGLQIIKAACEKAEVRFEYIDRAIHRIVPQDKMSAEFYANINVYVNASIEEGTPNPILEAMASGRPVITTKCGITPQLVVDNVNGFFVERDVDSIAEKIRYVRTRCNVESMGKWANASVSGAGWGWQSAAEAFDYMIQSELKKCAVANAAKSSK